MRDDASQPVGMTPDELALRAAINVLQDSIESRCMPSGEPLEGPGLDMHRQAARRLASLLLAVQAGTALPPPCGQNGRDG